MSTAITPTTGPGNLGTTITQSGNLYDITGGTRPGNGTNLFHSFGEFGVPTNNIANFLNETSLPTSNILGRVTGGNISNIIGTIQTTGFGNVNLFLMNPTGFLFGPNATVNVGGMVAFTTADYLRLDEVGGPNAGIFHADLTQSSVLTSAPVAAFGFLGSNPAAIAVQGSQLTLANGTGLSLVGGNRGFTYTDPDTGLPAAVPDGMTMIGGRLSAQGGEIALASVASPGEILAGTLNQAPTINGQTFGNLGKIHISEKSVLDVSGDGGGTIRIRGGNFIVDDSIISANVTGPGPITNGVESIGGGIDIQVSQDAVIQNLAVLETNVVGNATPDVQYGSVHVEAEHIEIAGVLDFELFPFTGIRSNVLPESTGGNSGDVKLEANSILVKDIALVDTLTDGAGDAGNIILRTNQNLVIDNIGLIESISSFASGNAGNIELTSAHGNILMRTPFVTSQTIESSGNAGNISVTAQEGDVLLADQGSLFNATRGTGALGGIQITANNLQIINESAISGDNLTTQVPGNITVTLSGSLSLSGNSLLQTIARKSAPAADLTITAHDVLITEHSTISTETVSSGPGGQLNIFAENLQLTNGSQLRSGSTISPLNLQPIFPSGPGGTITIQGLASPAESVLIDGPGSGIFTDTQGTGAGGNIFVDANSVTLRNGGTLSASTSGTASPATGGSITVNTTDHLTMTGGASITASSTGPGDAGNVTISGDSLAIASGGRIEASTSGAGDGGSIAITTTGDVTVTGLSANGQVRSGIFAKTLSAGSGSSGGSGGGGSGSGGGSGGGGTAPNPGSAGDITITAKNLLLDGGAQIDSSTTSGGAGGRVSITTAENITIAGSSTRLTSDATRGNGKGGNITLVAKNITVRDNASVTAATGGKGDAGNVTLTALDQLLLQSAGTVATSTSGSGKGGTITIQAGQVLLDGQGTGITADTLRPFANMTITINILHLNDGDLVVQLDSPTGTRVALLSRVGGNGDNFTGTQFNDQATTQITSGSAPFTGTFTPREPLGQLNNELVAGNWTLNVRDQATGNPGSLESWTLQIGTQTFQSTGGSIVIPDNGNVRSTITVANPTVPTVQAVGEPAGIGGIVTINAGTVTVQNGATISATTRGSGQGGTLTVNATGAVALTGPGSGIFTDTQGTGAGGNIFVNANSVALQNGATVSASSTGQIENPGDAGSIDITATNGLTMQNSTITTEAGQGASGGNIKVTTSPEATVLLTNNSLISASVADGPGGGGNISIDPQYVILQNSQILATAQGQGGAITITANLFLPDANSIVSADSGSGLHGTVTIQSPNAPASGKIQPLGKTPLQATSLLNQHCAALAGGEFSSFTVAGRDSLPTEPGSWLASPLATLNAGMGLGAKAEGVRSVAQGEGLEDKTPLLSLRQIAPPGFLTQAFTLDWSAGCQS